jgi:hypothetical protein
MKFFDNLEFDLNKSFERRVAVLPRRTSLRYRIQIFTKEGDIATFIDVVYIKEECKLFVNILKKIKS